MKTKQLAQRQRHISVNSKAARRRRLRIECLEQRRLLAFNYGDAPEPYPVSRADEGASHYISSLIDNEPMEIYGLTRENLGSSIAFNSSGDAFVASASGGKLIVYNLRAGEWVRKGIPIETGGFYSLAINSTGDVVAVNGSFGVYVYRFNGSNWESNVIPGAAARWGSGKTIALSASGETLITSNSYFSLNTQIRVGKAEVYSLVNNQWTLTGSWNASSAFTFLGSSVDINAEGSRIAIGILGSNTSGYQNASAVHLYDRVGSSWAWAGAVNGVFSYTNASTFGEFIALSGDGKTLAIPSHTGSRPTKVYRQTDASGWTQLGNDIIGPTGVALDLNANGTRIVTGDPWANSNFEGSGYIQVYDLVGEEWISVGEKILGEENNAGYGRSLSISDDGSRIATANTSFDANRVEDTGKVVIYDIIAQSGLRLGPTAMGTNDGVNEADSNNQLASHDGIRFKPLIVGQSQAVVTVNVQNASDGAKLDAWIDFNSDGTWYGEDERIFESVSVTEGDNTLTFSIPSDAVPGTSYARFRLSSAGELGVKYAAHDGEVEDHPVVIHPALGSGVFGSQQVLSSVLERASDLTYADLDSDGDLDLVVASQASFGVVILQNNGLGEFSHIPLTTSPLGMRSVAIGDLDGDGLDDIVSASSDDNNISWFKNMGAMGFERYQITGNAMGATAVRLGDLNEDGGLDVLALSTEDDTVRWFSNTGPGTFTENIVDQSLSDPWQANISDVNQDGHLDVLVASMGDNSITLYTGNGNGGFEKSTLSNSVNSARSVISFDYDLDGDRDVASVSTTDNRIYIHENAGNSFLPPIPIGPSIDNPVTIVASDIDGDLDLDLLVSSLGNSIYAFFNNGGIFTDSLITDSAIGPRAIAVLDINRDEQLDIVSASYSSNQIAWHEQIVLNHKPTLNTISDVTTPVGTLNYTVPLSGISAGFSETQPLRITAQSSNLTILPNPEITYSGTGNTASLRFTSQHLLAGTSEVIVTLEDGGLDNDLNTVADNSYAIQSFNYSITEIGEVLTIPLPSAGSSDLIAQYSDNSFIVQDTASGDELFRASRTDLPNEVVFVGSPTANNRLVFHKLSDGNQNAPERIWRYAGGALTDEVEIVGSGDEWAWLSSDPLVGSDYFVQIKHLTSLIDSYSIQGVEALRIAEVDRIEFDDPYLEITNSQLQLDSMQPVRLPASSELNTGTIASSTQIGLDTSESIQGEGVIASSVVANVGSLIRASGDLVIGDQSLADGFHTDGRLDVSENTVTLLDSNQVELGSLTTLGNSQPGILHSDHGFILEFGDNLEGYGTIQSDTAGTVINNGSIIGTSAEQPITINSRVKGVGTFNNVVMNGEFTPGFSPALWKSGTVAYTDLNRFVVELGGRLAGAEFDRVEHYLAKLGGTLDVQLIDGFKPALGDLFEVITSEQPFEGDFNQILLPPDENGVRIRELLGQHGIELEAVFDVTGTLEVLKSQVSDYQIAGRDGSSLKVQGDRFRAFVNSSHEFVAQHPWHTEQLALDSGKLIQIATDGVNRLMIEGSNWKNFVEPSDINNDQNVTSLDALTVINELYQRSQSDDLTSELSDAAILVTGEAHFYDQNGDGKCTALDALRVINDLARSSVNGEGEAVTADYLTQDIPSIGSPGTESYSEPFESKFEETELLYSDAAPEASRVSDRPEDLVYATTGQESTEAVDSLLSDLDDWWK